MKTGFFSEKIEQSIVSMTPEERQLASWIMQNGKLYNFGGGSFIKVEADEVYPRSLLNNDDLSLRSGPSSVVPIFAERENDCELFFLNDPAVESLLHEFWGEPLWNHYLETGDCVLVPEKYAIGTFKQFNLDFKAVVNNPVYTRYCEFSGRRRSLLGRSAKVYVNVVVDQLLYDICKLETH